VDPLLRASEEEACLPTPSPWRCLYRSLDLEEEQERRAGEMIMCGKRESSGVGAYKSFAIVLGIGVRS
jgi:hypothetical protein